MFEIVTGMSKWCLPVVNDLLGRPAEAGARNLQSPKAEERKSKCTKMITR